MILDNKRNLVAVYVVRIALAINALVVMSHHERHVCVKVDLLENGLADRGVLLHLPTLVEG